MVDTTIESEAEVMRKIDEQLKGLSADVRAEAFQILVARHLGQPRRLASKSTPGAKPANPKRGSSKAKSHFSVVKDLDLKKSGANPSLRDFYAQKRPKAFSEQNAVFVFYLNKIKEIDTVTPETIYTCYKEIGVRVPGAFYQSLLDTSRIKGWIDTADTNKIRITTVGENFVEHDLPRGSEE